jgi:hypothetical protein
MNNSVSGSPLIVELGRRKGKQIRGLRKGEGPLMDELMSALDQLRADGRLAAGSTPVAVVVKQKSSCRSILGIR